MSYEDPPPPPGSGPNEPYGSMPGQVPPPPIPGGFPGGGFPGQQPMFPGYYPPVVQSPVNPLSIISLISSILGLLCCQIFAVAGLVCGAIALYQGKDDPYANQASKVLSIIGIVVGAIALIIMIVFFGFYLSLFLSLGGASATT